jgi:hypothetical protein
MADGRFSRSRPLANHLGSQSLTRAEGSTSHANVVSKLFHRMVLSLDTKGKQKERRPKREAAKVVDVPLAPATYVCSFRLHLDRKI